MSDNIHLEEKFEIFEGDLRKLDELTNQLGLWCDENTINHKKEETRLAQYVELNFNLEELKEVIQNFLSEMQLELELEEEMYEKINKYKEYVQDKLVQYEEIEQEIHKWVRDIKDIHILVAKNDVLREQKDYIDKITNKK
ncbi:MAG: hypothetical protein ACRCSG_06705 [Cellulosilyticaceae bacterium]